MVFWFVFLLVFHSWSVVSIDSRMTISYEGQPGSDKEGFFPSRAGMEGGYDWGGGG